MAGNSKDSKILAYKDMINQLKPQRTNISLWLFALYIPPMQKNTQNILEKLQEKVIMSKMTHLIKYKQIFYQIINENAGDVVNGTAAYVYQSDDP